MKQMFFLYWDCVNCDNDQKKMGKKGQKQTYTLSQPNVLPRSNLIPVCLANMKATAIKHWILPRLTLRR